MCPGEPVPRARPNAARAHPAHTCPCAQALTVTEQLDTGVRYLDLRVAHMPGGSARNLHFVHMVYTTALVEVGGGRGTGTHGHPRPTPRL